MFTRQQMKEAAKLNMKKNMNRSIAVVFLALLPSMIFSFAGAYIENFNTALSFITGTYPLGGDTLHIIYGFNLLSTLIYIFVTSVTTVGALRYFLKLRGDVESTATEAYAPYSEKIAGGIIKTMFATWLLIVLGWIVIIPGFIFTFRYALVSQVLAVNPGVGGKRARELSRELMKEHWGDYFVPMLSFLGWFILSGFTMGLLAIFYVDPYLYATLAEFYSCRRAEVVSRGAVSPNELPSFGNDWYSPYNTNGPYGSYGYAQPAAFTPPVFPQDGAVPPVYPPAPGPSGYEPFPGVPFAAPPASDVPAGYTPFTAVPPSAPRAADVQPSTPSADNPSSENPSADIKPSDTSPSDTPPTE